MSKIKTAEQLSEEAVNELEAALQDEDFLKPEAETTSLSGKAAGHVEKQTLRADDMSIEFALSDFDRTVEEATKALRDEANLGSPHNATPSLDEFRFEDTDFLPLDTLSQADAPLAKAPVVQIGAAAQNATQPELASNEDDKPSATVLAAADESSRIRSERRSRAPSQKADPRHSAAAPLADPVRGSRSFKGDVANDEQRSAAVMADALLSRRSSNKPVVIGGVVAAAWAALSASASYSFLASESGLASNIVPLLAPLAAAVVLPPLMIMGFSVMMRRSQDLRLMSRGWPRSRCAWPSRKALPRIVSPRSARPCAAKSPSSARASSAPWPA